MLGSLGDRSVDTTSAFEMSSPNSLLAEDLPAHMEHDYNFSGAVYDDTTDHALTTDEEQITDPHSLLQSAPSRHSSVSSFPASVVYHAPLSERSSTPSRSPFYHGRATTPTTSPRPYTTGFRHPSSVRALQMRDEFDTTDGEDATPSHRRRNSKISYLSYRSGSCHSSPTKSLRLSRSAHTSPSKTKAKQEFPLVLLHCSLLPPRLTARAKLLSTETSGEESVLEAILPKPYAQKWKILQEKVVRNLEVRSRGILIPHPRDDYDLLEERLLESLELERPRIRQGHYFSKSQPEVEVDSGFESGDTDSDTQQGTPMEDPEVQQGGKCPDCGHHVSSGIEEERNWDVKVFAANGLMKAGAWNAGWNEMEKVDVEVGVWMPEDVRREVDARLEALIAKEFEAKPKKEKRSKNVDEQRRREIYGEPTERIEQVLENQGEIGGMVDIQKLSVPGDSQVRLEEKVSTSQPYASVSQPELSAVLANYIQLLVRDSRNVAILLLSMLLLYYGVKHEQIQVLSAQSNATNMNEIPSVTTTATQIQSLIIPASSVNTASEYEHSTMTRVGIQNTGVADGSSVWVGNEIQSEATSINAIKASDTQMTLATPMLTTDSAIFEASPIKASKRAIKASNDQDPWMTRNRQCGIPEVLFMPDVKRDGICKTDEAKG